MLSFAAPEAAAQTNQTDGNCRGGGESGDFEIGIVVDLKGEYDILMTDMTTGIPIPESQKRISQDTPKIDGCQYRAYAGGGEGADSAGVAYQTDRLYRLDIVSLDDPGLSGSYYTYFIEHCAPGSSVFCPQERTGYDTVIFLRDNGPRIYPQALPGVYGQPGAAVEDYFPDGRWVLPYDFRAFCSGAICPTRGAYTFFSPAPLPGAGPATLPVTLHASTGADWRVDAGRTWNWSSSDVTAIDFGAGGAMTVTGQLNATGVTLTAANPAEGWSGVRFEPGSGGMWTDATVERVRGANASEFVQSPATHAITVTDASPTFTRVKVRLPAANTGPVDGFYVRETAAPVNPVVISDPDVTGMTGSRIVANGGARIDLASGTLTGSGAPAVVSGGSGSVVYLAPLSGPDGPRGAMVTGNAGGGVAAAASGAVRFGAPSPADGFTTVAENPGTGLSASGGGVLYAGTASVYRRNRIYSNAFGNATSGNALAAGTGSRIYAACNWWNAEVAPYRTAAVRGGLVTVSAALAQDPYTNPSAPCSGTSTEGRSSGDRFAGAVAGRSSVTAIERLMAALDAATPAETAEALAALVADEPDTEEAAAALGEAGTLAARGEAAATALLVSSVSSPYADLRVAAGQALVASRRALGDRAGSFDAAEALAAEGGAALVQAELARVYLHAESGDEASALDALERLESLAPESVEAGLGRSHLGLDVEAPMGGRGVTPPVAARGATAGAAAADAPTDAAAKAEVDAEAVTLGVRPNPAATEVAVTLTLAEAAEVTVTVYDLLGRAVAVPLAGWQAAGAHRAAVDVAALAPGVYVVRAVVNTAAGPAVQTARLTVAR